jgi:hypothetical protein
VTRALIFCLLVGFAHPALAGILVVETKPRFPVKIRIDGKVRGSAPLTWTRCRKGKHTLVIKHPFFMPVKKKIRCKRRSITKVKIKLKDLRWVLDINSSPAQLQVLINDKKACITPCVHSASLRKAFRVDVVWPNGALAKRGAPWSKTLRMKPSQRLKLKAEIPHGVLKVTAEPKIGEFTLEPLGGIDAEAIALPPGDYVIKVTNFGKKKFPSWQEKQVKIGIDGSTVTVDPPTFGAAPGLLSLDSSPTGAAVLLGEKKTGVTPLNEHPIAVGAYELSLCKSGFRQRSFFIKANAGDQLQVDTVQLVPYTILDRLPGGVITVSVSGSVLALGTGLVSYAGSLKSDYTALWDSGTNYEKQRALANQHAAVYPLALASFGLGVLGSSFSAYKMVYGATPKGSKLCVQP